MIFNVLSWQENTKTIYSLIPIYIRVYFLCELKLFNLYYRNRSNVHRVSNWKSTQLQNQVTVRVIGSILLSHGKKIPTVMILVWKNGLCANHQSFGEINFRLNLTYHYPGSDIFSQCQVVFILRSVQLILNKYHVTIKGDSICHTKAFFRWHMLINRIAFTPYLNKSNFNLPHKSDFATQKIMSC